MTAGACQRPSVGRSPIDEEAAPIIHTHCRVGIGRQSRGAVACLKAFDDSGQWPSPAIDAQDKKKEQDQAQAACISP